MRSLHLPAAMLVALVTLLGAPRALVAAQAAVSPSSLSVTVDQTEISTQLGRSFTFRSTIRNDGPTTVRGLIAHLNVLGLSKDVYVDPEDWSSERTRYLDPIPVGATTTLRWPIHAVNGGALGLYVAVFPGRSGGSAPATTQMIRLDVTEKKTLNTGGILPLALGIPGLIGLLALCVRGSRRRQPTR